MDEKLLQVYDRLVNYFFSGEMAFAVLNTIRQERENRPLVDNDLFVFTSIISTFNTSILVMANTIKPNSDSIHLAYLFKNIKLSQDNIDIETHNKLISFVSEFEGALINIKHITDRVIALRDTAVAHIDKKHLSNLSSLLQNPPISWEDMTLAYSVVGSGLLEIGKHLGSDPNLQDHATLAFFALENKTRLICRLP
jgi:hypothetical protein